jgi:hypothetical protein
MKPLRRAVLRLLCRMRLASAGGKTDRTYNGVGFVVVLRAVQSGNSTS